MAKELHGLRRTQFKGRWKVQTQPLLTAAPINIKRASGKLRKTVPLVKGTLGAIPKAFSTGMSSLDAAKKIAAGIYRIVLCPHNHFGNSPG